MYLAEQRMMAGLVAEAERAGRVEPAAQAAGMLEAVWLRRLGLWAHFQAAE